MTTLATNIVLLLAAILGAGGGFRYFIEPFLRRRRLRKVMATGLWLSCHELRCHLEVIKEKLGDNSTLADNTRNALPKNDFGGRADWFVKAGYFTMITAYKIAAFSSWVKIYQRSVLLADLTTLWSDFITELFQKFDNYKVAASSNTVLWYDYIDAIGEKIVTTENNFRRPLDFSVFCEKYYGDKEFLFYFNQLHMFIHFIGKKDSPWSKAHQDALSNMIDCLKDI